MKNDRLNHVGYLWTFSALQASTGAMAHYRQRDDEHGDWHASERFVGSSWQYEEEAGVLCLARTVVLIVLHRNF